MWIIITVLAVLFLVGIAWLINELRGAPIDPMEPDYDEDDDSEWRY